MSFFAKSVVTGFIGGLLWSSIGYLAYFFHFTKISPNIVLQPMPQGNWQKNWQGVTISILLIGIISIGVALVYYGLLRKIKGMWGGIVFGVVLFCFVVFLLNPLFPAIGPIKKLSMNTIVTTLCLYILYGVFIGYSISYEENEFHQNNQQGSSRT